MIVDAPVFRWSPEGMRPTSENTGYIHTSKVVELLEEAHRNGFAQGKKETLNYLYGKFKTP